MGELIIILSLSKLLCNLQSHLVIQSFDKTHALAFQEESKFQNNFIHLCPNHLKFEV